MDGVTELLQGRHDSAMRLCQYHHARNAK